MSGLDLQEDCEHWRDLLKEHSKHLKVLEKQIAKYTEINAPPHLIVSRDDLQQEIAALQQKLYVHCGEPLTEQAAGPEEQPRHVRNIYNVVQWSLIGVATCLAWLLTALYLRTMLQSDWNSVQLGVVIAGNLTLLGFTLLCFNLVVAEFSASAAIAAKNRQRGWIFGGLSACGMVTFALLTAFSNVVNAEAVITLVLLAAMLVLTVVPLAFGNQRLAQRWKSMFDGGILGVAFIMVLTAIFGNSIFPWFMTLALGIVGLVLLVVCFVAYARGDSFFDAIATIRKKK